MEKSGAAPKVESGKPAQGVEKEIADYEATLPKDFHDVKIERCERVIDSSRAQRLMAAWKAVLLETRFNKPGDESAVVTDGTAVHFADMSEYPYLAGWTIWAPDGSEPAALWDMADAMWDYCDKPGAASSAQFDKKLAVLEASLQSGRK